MQHIVATYYRQAAVGPWGLLGDSLHTPCWSTLGGAWCLCMQICGNCPVALSLSRLLLSPLSGADAPVSQEKGIRICVNSQNLSSRSSPCSNSSVNEKYISLSSRRRSHTHLVEIQRCSPEGPRAVCSEYVMLVQEAL